MPADLDPIVLQEYGQEVVNLTRDQVDALEKVSDDRLTITRANRGSGWRIKAKSYVGTIVTPDVRILIKPKVPTANLFAMLEAGGKAVATKDSSFDFATTDDLVPSFSTFYARHLEKALLAGVPREYFERSERLPSVRGRVDLTAQQRLTGLSTPVECRFDDYLADTSLARVLRSAATKLMRLPGVTTTTHRALRQLSEQLQDAGPATAADLRGKIAFTRLNAHCRPAEQLARMVHSTSSLLDAAGRANASAFLIDMNRVFEEFVAARLKRYLAGRVEVHLQYRRAFDEGQSHTLRPDLVFVAPSGEVVYVADTKYKVTTEGYGKREDYYQLLAYVSVLAVEEGMLIYCRRDGDPLPRELNIPHARKRLRTFVLDLDGSLADVESQLSGLADHIADRAIAMSET